MRRRAWTLLLAVIAVLIVLLLVLRGRGGQDGHGEAAESGEAARAAADHAVKARVPPAHIQSATPAEARFQKVLDDYRREAVYPPWSRPLDAGAEYKLHWNEPIITELPFSDRPGAPLVYRFGADRHHVMHGEELTTWIEVYPPGQPEARVPVKVHQAWVLATSGAKQGRKVNLSYRDAGDHRPTNRFTPSSHEELADAAQVVIMAEVEADGVRRQMNRDFTYAARPVIELHGITDSVRDGSVVVTLDVEVHETGLYTFEANMMSGDGETPIAYADTSRHLAEGRTNVDVVFFGRIFHDAAVPGPYLLRDLRGFLRFLDGSQPNVWWSWPAMHTTAAIALDQLSAAEWDSPEKQEKIRRLEDFVEQARSGEPMTPP